MKNEVYKSEWKEHSSYLTKGEAQLKSIRLELFLSRATKIIFDGEKYWIVIQSKHTAKKINHSLEV